MKNTIASKVEIEHVIEKSRFVGILLPIQSKDDLHQALATIEQAHPKANHIVHAALFGDSMSLDDDGEPAKTAASPMLDVIHHHQLNNVLMVAVRYFGGVKLGAGGLVRAYTKTAAMAMESATILVPEPRYPYVITCTYETFYKLPTLITYQVVTMDYQNHVTVTLQVDSLERGTLERVKHLFIEMIALEVVVEYVAKKE
jgi:uncharacterized YigZ family protein